MLMSQKMKVGMVGLGKLGLPCLLAMEKHGGVEVFGFDVNQNTIDKIVDRSVDYWEANVNDYLFNSKLQIVESAGALVPECDIIFVAVPTPHEKEFEGLTPVPDLRKDFDYSYLRSAVDDLAIGLRENPENNPLIVVISTVLPGTMRKEVLPLLQSVRSNVRFVYNPYFIAMGTTISDFLNPEFLLLGSDNFDDLKYLESFYHFLSAKTMPMAIESAELTKVAYNTFIGFKIVFANALAEITSVRGGNVDEVTDALSKANHRLMSPKYLSAGMADGGGCHPRDQIAMSWLANDAGMSVDVFEFIAKARDSQTCAQAKMVKKYANDMNLKAVILGKSYKENSPLVVGSPALLLCHYLDEFKVDYHNYDPWVDGAETEFADPAVFFVATKHEIFRSFKAKSGSVIIDPWGYVETSPGVKLIRPGRV